MITQGFKQNFDLAWTSKQTPEDLQVNKKPKDHSKNVILGFNMEFSGQKVKAI